MDSLLAGLAVPPARGRSSGDLDVDVRDRRRASAASRRPGTCAGRGVQATVLEARTAASGASGRNGGFLIAGPAPFHNDARAPLRTRAARRHPAGDDRRPARGARDRRGARRRRPLPAAAARCGSRRRRGERAPPRAVEALHEDGFPASSSGDDLPVELRGPGGRPASRPTTAGCSRRAGSARFARGAEAPRRRAIFERTPVAAPLGARDGAASCCGRRAAASAPSAWSSPPTGPAGPGAGGRAHVRAGACTWSPPRRRRPARCASSSTRAGATSTTSTADGRVTLGGYSDIDGAELVHRARGAIAARASSGSSGTCARSSASRPRSPIAGSASSATGRTSGRSPARCPARTACSCSAATTAPAT